MGYDYMDLPYCRDCEIPMEQEERYECALRWRPQTGTKIGFPMEDGWNCPKDSLTEEIKSALHTIECYKRITEQGDVLLQDNTRY